MNDEERKAQQRDLVESLGCLYEKNGFQRTAGRILGLLTIMDKEQYTFDEIIEELNISKSSASTALQLLEAMNAIEYITLPGDRKRYFQLKKQDKWEILNNHMRKLQTTCEFLNKALELKSDKNSRNAKYIESHIDIINFFLKKFEEVKKDYESKEQR